MRNTTIWWMAALSLAALGCSGSGGSGGLTPEPVPTGNALPQTGTAGLGAVAVNGDLSQSALALFTIDVDPSTLSAAVRLKETRQATATDDVYHLSIGNFMNAGTVKVTNITGTATTLDISYAVTHPFGVPADLDAPATAANRLDLGISGRVLFMADVASAAGNTYFTDVVANTSLVRNADGLVRPRGMLDTTGFTANTFPFKSLVDETQDPRTGTASGSAVSNGGLVTGNYDGTTGWQRSNLGGNKDGWTGYGTLHQGQTASNMVSLDLATISAGGSFSMDVAILAKYQDPRGGSTPTQKKANRLPAATADINQFAYRRPHGSNDLESVRFEGES
ncbi:MAG TPA: hypothetical protein VEI97_20800, partial [bacterium]|nr:hypothetical protein [bacterium]